MGISDPLTLALLDEVRLRKLYQKILRTERASLISYLPLRETSGAVAYDLSGNGYNGASVNVTLGGAGIGDGWPSYGFDGASAYVNWYSAALAAAFNGAEGTLLAWGRMPAAAWIDGLNHWLVGLWVDANNRIDLRKATTDNTLQATYIAGGTIKLVTSVALGGLLTSFCMGMTWKTASDAFAFYLSGVQSGATRTGLGVWAGTLAATGTVIGAQTTTPTTPWLGNGAHVALWSKALTPAQVAYVSKV